MRRAPRLNPPGLAGRFQPAAPAFGPRVGAVTGVAFAVKRLLFGVTQLLVSLLIIYQPAYKKAGFLADPMYSSYVATLALELNRAELREAAGLTEFEMLTPPRPPPTKWRMTCGIVCGICMLTLCLFGSVSIFLAIGEETFAKPPPEVAESAA